jgi:hypothetical protein
VALADWFLTAAERGNGATRLDDRHPDGAAWSPGNSVRPLIHGATYFAELKRAVEQMVRGDLLLFVDWRGDPDEMLTPEPGSEVSRVLCRAAHRARGPGRAPASAAVARPAAGRPAHGPTAAHLPAPCRWVPVRT